LQYITDMTKDTLRIPGIVLLVSMIFSLCGIIKSEGVLRDILVNLFVTIIGILATVFLIDRVIEEDAEKKRHKILQTAFQRLPLKGQLSLFMSIGRSTSPEGEIKNYLDLYDEKYYEYLKKLDFSSKGPGRWNTGKDMNWGEYITFSWRIQRVN
jgi:hypothetical protein